MNIRRIIYSLLIILIFNKLQAQNTNKSPKLKAIFWQQYRLTSFDNAISLDNEAENWNYARFKTKFGLKYNPIRFADLKVVMGNESRIWFSPSVKQSYLGTFYFDELYVKINKIFNKNWSWTLGRQNIILDEGFLCLDGQPLMGSNSISFNAIRTDYSFTEHNIFTSFASFIPHTDKFLPVLNQAEIPKMLEERANAGMGLYFKHLSKNFDYSIYSFAKQSYKNEYYPTEKTVYTLGVRLNKNIAHKIQLTGETAYQLGKNDEQKINAYGGYFHADYLFKKGKFKSIGINGFYMSGDKLSSTTDEAWDPLWSRWPKWSESYFYTLIKENNGKAAYWSNIASLSLKITGNFSRSFSFQSKYIHLWALEHNMSEFCNGTGKNRGDLFTCRLNYKLNEHWSGQYILEYFIPENFYPSTADNYYWTRFQLAFKL